MNKILARWNMLDTESVAREALSRYGKTSAEVLALLELPMRDHPITRLREVLEQQCHITQISLPHTLELD